MRRLGELDADPVCGAPDDTATSLDAFRFDQESEIVRYADRACDFERRPGLRDVADYAVDGCPCPEQDGSAFESAKSLTATLLGHCPIYELGLVAGNAATAIPFRQLEGDPNPATERLIP
jgi:hypothetical protein